MAYKTFVDGVALPASDINTYLMKQAVNVCTSGTRPAGPGEGQPIYETDSDSYLMYTTASTGWRAPWNLPWGYIGKTTSTSTTSGITSEQDVLTVTFNAVQNRRYKMTLIVHYQLGTTFGTVITKITDNTPTTLQQVNQTVAQDEQHTETVIVEVDAAVTGSATYRGRISTNAGSITLTGAAGARIHYLLVEDMGPAGAPA